MCEWSDVKKRRKREASFGIKWKVEEKKKEKKREDGDIWVYVCGGEKTREKKKKKKEMYGWNKGIGIFFFQITLKIKKIS